MSLRRTEAHLIALSIVDISPDAKGGLQHVESYEAVSYVCGPNYPGKEISIEGCGHFIGGNLYQFLKQKQLSDGRCTLYVDALCISQTDAAGRSAQVRLMGEIYSRATQVIVWLGSGEQFNPFQESSLMKSQKREASQNALSTWKTMHTGRGLS